MNNIKIEIDLKFPHQVPDRKEGSIFSESVFGIDEEGETIALVYNHHTDKWHELGADEFDCGLSFRWFYVPKSLKNMFNKG